MTEQSPYFFIEYGKMDVMTKDAYFGGGCFWCLEAVFERLDGVEKVTSGYAGGHDSAPDYEKVCTGKTGHAEMVKITYDPEKIDYSELLDFFWNFHDPTTLNRQGNDIGTQYRSIVFYQDEKEKEDIETSIREVASKMYRDPVVTEVTALNRFYPAEDYHGKYFQNNPESRYCQYVIAPKVARLKKGFADKLKENATSH